MIDEEGESLRRARSAVANVLIAASVGILGSGVILRSAERGVLWRQADRIRPWAYGGLLAIVLLSRATYRVLARSESKLGTAIPHVTAAAIGWMAVPIGFAYGFGVDPRLEAVAPFWVAALGLGVLAWPRRRAAEERG